MRLLYIAPEFPPNYWNFILRLAARGVEVVGIGQSDFFEMPENVRASMAWYERVDLNNWDAVNYSINKIIAIKGKIDLVESHDEHWLRLEAKINDEFHFAGINHQLIDSWKRKDEMKKLFVANDIKVAKGKTVKNFSEALAFAQEIGYPAILKPNEGVGAIGAFKIRNEEQLRSTMEQNGHYNFLMEEFITAPIVTYDGITDFSGNILFESSLKYASGVLEIVNGVDPAFYVCREISKKLSEIGKKIVQIFQLKRKFFHIELFDFDDHYAPMEINCRPPGGPIVDMMNYSCDVDLYDVYAQMMAGQKVTLSSAKDYFCGYAGRSERGFFYSLADVKKKIGSNMLEMAENPPLYHQAMGKYKCIFRAKSDAELQGMYNFILEKRY